MRTPIKKLDINKEIVANEKIANLRLNKSLRLTWSAPAKSKKGSIISNTRFSRSIWDKLSCMKFVTPLIPITLRKIKVREKNEAMVISPMTDGSLITR